jgi:hypothetical protein
MRGILNKFVSCASFVAVGIVIAACSSSSSGSGGGPGSSDGGSEASTFVDGGDSDATMGAQGRCALSPTCMAVDKTCVGLVDNGPLDPFGLRMSELDLTAPQSLASGMVGKVIAGGAGLSSPECNQEGTGQFNWLLQFDTTAMTLKTGGAKPVADPTQGFYFDEETVQEGSASFAVQPVTYAAGAPDGSGHFSTSGQSLVMPVFLDLLGSQSILLPMRQVSFTGTMTSRNCLGTYNAAGLDPANNCIPSTSPAVPGFLDAAKFSGFITLEDADKVVVAQLAESLCVVLSGGSGTVCARNGSSQIVFQGDWCSTTNAAATETCADAVQIGGNFAASSVKILGTKVLEAGSPGGDAGEGTDAGAEASSGP